MDGQIDARGLVLKAGTPIDATLVEAAVARRPQHEGEVSTLDPDVGFTRRGQKSFSGFKAHLAVDLGSDLGRTPHRLTGEVGPRRASRVRKLAQGR